MLLVVVAAICQEVGAAFAVGLFAALGAIGAVCVRFLVAGSILCVAVRPRLRGLSGRAWFSAVAGWLILGQHLAVTAYVAIVLVTVASIGAVRSARDRLGRSDTRLITA